MNIDKIVLGARFRKDMGDIRPLAESIRVLGLLHPVVVTPKGELIAGVRRMQAFRFLGRADIPATVVDLDDLARGEIEENQVRKDFTVSEQVAIKKALEVKLQPRVGRPAKGNGGKLPQLKGQKTRDVVAAYVGTSERTLAKAESVVDAAGKEPEKYGALLQKVDKGQVSVDYAFQAVKRDAARADTPVMPEGQFGVLCADPPWEYDFGLRGSPESHYQSMSLDKLKALEPPAAPDSILFLWATAPKLLEALDLMKAWGWTYKSLMVWSKVKDGRPQLGTGYYSRNNIELLLIGTKGDTHPPAEADRPLQLIQAPRGEHSEKPASVYAMIERMYPGRKYLELFARGKARPGWTSWGAEAE